MFLQNASHEEPDIPEASGGQGHEFLWAPRARGMGSSICFVNLFSDPEEWFFCSSHKISPAVTCHKPPFAGCLLGAYCVPGLVYTKEPYMALGLPEPAAQTRPHRELSSLAPVQWLQTPVTSFVASPLWLFLFVFFLLSHNGLLLP